MFIDFYRTHFSFLLNCKDKLTDKNKLSSNSAQKSWKKLFNGKDLEDWIVKINGHKLYDNFKNTFRVVNGILKVSYDEYENFENRFGLLIYKYLFQITNLDCSIGSQETKQKAVKLGLQKIVVL